jgi:hypothetical protein
MTAFSLPLIGSLRRRLLVRMVAAAALALALFAITSAYLEPGFVVTVANQLWTCF